MGLIEGISKNARSVPDDYISRMVSESLKNRYKVDAGPSDYFYLTDLVNPIQTYFKKTRKDIEYSPELTQKLDRGTKLGRISGLWFRNLPGFVIQEARLDGANVGINGVVGKIDYRVGDSIIEFKTKPDQVLDVDTIFNYFPQDLEQLLFYVAISYKPIDTHYLVFMKDTSPYALTVFKIKINNLGVTQNLLKQRIIDLNRALDQKNPNYLKRCRYLEFDCAYKGGTCDCENRDTVSIDVIKRNVEISRDEELEKQLEEVRQVDSTKFDEVFPFWSLLTPRSWFIQKIIGEKKDYPKNNEKDLAEVSLGASVFRTAKLKLTNTETMNLKDSEEEFPVRVPHSKFVKLRVSGINDASEEIVPYIVYASTGNTISRLSDYQIAKLGITCAKFGKSRGVVFVIYPKINNNVIAYDVTYNNIKKIKSDILKTIANLSEAGKEGCLTILDKCPDWMCKTCNLSFYCVSS